MNINTAWYYTESGNSKVRYKEDLKGERLTTIP